MAELKNQPPGSPVPAATRPPPDSTDAQKDSAIAAIRQARAGMPGRKPYDPNLPEKRVAVHVLNGGHAGYYSIGRFFPNGLSTNVPVTDDELAELEAEPKEVIRVVTPAEIAEMQGKESSGSSAPALTDEEQKVLADFRSSGLDADTYLAPTSGTGTASGASSKPATPSSPSSDEAGSSKAKHK